MDSFRISFVIPCYNEAGGIDSLYDRASASARQVANTRYEIVFVNDGSRNATWARPSAKAAGRPEHGRDQLVAQHDAT